MPSPLEEAEVGVHIAAGSLGSAAAALVGGRQELQVERLTLEVQLPRRVEEAVG